MICKCAFPNDKLSRTSFTIFSAIHKRNLLQQGLREVILTYGSSFITIITIEKVCITQPNETHTT